MALTKAESTNNDSSKKPVCTTESGASPNLPCIFPFRYNNGSHTSCIWEDAQYTHHKPWCSTLVDKAGNHVRRQSKWGNCGPDCPISPDNRIPLKLIVTLKGELSNALGFLAGIYIRNPSSRNKIWLKDSGNIAIWYDSKLGRWIFGSHDDFGSPKTWIYSEDDVPGPQAATNWKYRLGRAIESDNILVHSLLESGTIH